MSVFIGWFPILDLEVPHITLTPYSSSEETETHESQGSRIAGLLTGLTGDPGAFSESSATSYLCTIIFQKANYRYYIQIFPVSFIMDERTSQRFNKPKFYLLLQATEQFAQKFQETFVQPKPSYVPLRRLSLGGCRHLSIFSSSKILHQTPHIPRQTELKESRLD